MLLGFVPFIAFTLLSNLSQDLALWAAFAAAFAVAIRDFAHERLLRLLDTGSTIIFALLALYAGFVQPGLSIQMTRLVVDGGFFALALVSILTRNPLTLQYAREQVPDEVRPTTRFVLTNYGLTMLWMSAFAVMAAADAISNIYKSLPLAFDASVGLVAVAAAIVVTARYPAYVHATFCANEGLLTSSDIRALPDATRQ
jgi:hypothetical protein